MASARAVQGGPGGLVVSCLAGAFALAGYRHRMRRDWRSRYHAARAEIAQRRPAYQPLQDGHVQLFERRDDQRGRAEVVAWVTGVRTATHPRPAAAAAGRRWPSPRSRPPRRVPHPAARPPAGTRRARAWTGSPPPPTRRRAATPPQVEGGGRRRRSRPASTMRRGPSVPPPPRARSMSRSRPGVGAATAAAAAGSARRSRARAADARLSRTRPAGPTRPDDLSTRSRLTPVSSWRIAGLEPGSPCSAAISAIVRIDSGSESTITPSMSKITPLSRRAVRPATASAAARPAGCQPPRY